MGVFHHSSEEKQFFYAMKVVKMATIYAMDMLVALDKFGGLNIDPVNSRWSKPPPGYSKFNVDGGFWDDHGS